ncbi:uncharacterized protein LOC122808528 [Protopterus annectens]|uniref:uncharacterized protein LOC122808528 n=1 Tax=Protopterus annectens TaxID=7888 RepID=UPI001CFAF2CB|nr:uncharacterized protein LOC122808528 [Protopterus annectens]
MTKLDFNMNYIFLLFWLYSHQHAVYSNFICDEPEPRGDTSKTLTCETVEVEMNSQDCENFYKYFACAEKKKCQQLHRFLNKYEDCVPKHQPLKQNGRMSTVCSTNVLNGKDTSYFITDDKTFTEKGFWTSEHPCEENKVYMNSVSVTTSNFIKVDIPGEVFVQKSETASVSFTMMWNSSLFQNLTVSHNTIIIHFAIYCTATDK